MAGSGEVARFQPMSSAVDVLFWHRLAQHKLDVQKLSQAEIDIQGHVAGALVGAGHTRAGRDGALWVREDAFEERQREAVPGVLLNVNTIEEFRAVDKKALLGRVAAAIDADVREGRAAADPHLLFRFLLIAFCDLKRYRFWYWFAFPTLNLAGPIQCAAPLRPLADVLSEAAIHSISASFDALKSAVAVVDAAADGSYAVRPLAAAAQEEPDAGQRYLLVRDTSTLPDHAGWPVRNVCYWARAALRCENVSVICARSDSSSLAPSVVIDLKLPALGEGVSAIGWEKNLKGKLGPRNVNLGSSFDPHQLASRQAALNLKLMKWRLMPSLDLDRIASTKCLLLGSGTLGCNVGRTLLGWGVKHITFLDNGRVSYSNPVRQSLFEFEDCLEGGAPKAVAAARKLKQIFPDVVSEGHQLSIPMPGHPVGDSELEAVQKDVERLRELISSHDAVFLLMDSRESRWLPTVLCQALNKICINAALGFDTYMVMRHGPSPLLPPREGVLRVGCYFCNDVVAPQDSLSNRTLDQQCTVTRPGVSYMAGALAVEMLVTILNHPLGVEAGAEVDGVAGAPSSATQEDTPLGMLPHQVRGYLSMFGSQNIVGHSYDKCTACSKTIVEEYLASGMKFLLRAFNSPSYLEDLSGLTAMKTASDEVDMGWEIDEDGDDDDLGFAL